MRYRVLAQLAACALLSTVATSSFATLVDFEGAPDLSAIPNGYGGLDWTANSFGMDSSAYTPNPSGYQNCTVSGTHVGFSAFAIDFGFATSDGSNFQTLSFYMGAAWNDGQVVHYVATDGGFGGTLVSEGDLTVDSTGPTQFFLNGAFAGMIDAFVFTPTAGTGTEHGWGGSGDHIVFDDIEYSTVPEPATMAVLGLGAAALLRRRRK